METNSNYLAVSADKLEEVIKSDGRRQFTRTCVNDLAKVLVIQRSPQ